MDSPLLCAQDMQLWFPENIQAIAKKASLVVTVIGYQLQLGFNGSSQGGLWLKSNLFHFLVSLYLFPLATVIYPGAKCSRKYLK